LYSYHKRRTKLVKTTKEIESVYNLYVDDPGVYTIYLQADKPYTHSITKP